MSTKTLGKVIYDLHWMARRYADGRSSYAPGLLNRHVNTLLAMGYTFKSPLYARDGMGRQFDGLTAAEVQAAEDDMPRGMQQVVAEQESRLEEFRNAVIEECADAIRRTRNGCKLCHDAVLALKAAPSQGQIEERSDTAGSEDASASLTQNPQATDETKEADA